MHFNSIYKNSNYFENPVIVHGKFLIFVYADNFYDICML